MKELWIVIVLALAGCAQTSQELVGDGIRFDSTSKSTPRLAALCALRVAEAFETAPLSAQIRETERAGDYEVVVHNPVDHHFPFAVIGTKATDGGTTIVIFLQRMSKYIGDELVGRIKARC